MNLDKLVPIFNRHKCAIKTALISNDDKKLKFILVELNIFSNSHQENKKNKLSHTDKYLLDASKTNVSYIEKDDGIIDVLLLIEKDNEPKCTIDKKAYISPNLDFLSINSKFYYLFNKTEYQLLSDQELADEYEVNTNKFLTIDVYPLKLFFDSLKNDNIEKILELSKNDDDILNKDVSLNNDANINLTFNNKQKIEDLEKKSKELMEIINNTINQFKKEYQQFDFKKFEELKNKLKKVRESKEKRSSDKLDKIEFTLSKKIKVFKNKIKTSEKEMDNFDSMLSQIITYLCDDED